MQVRELWLSELQENCIVKVIQISGDNHETDRHTKNLAEPLFEKHTKVYYDDDGY